MFSRKKTKNKLYKNDHEIIKNMIHTGQYFDEARKWYSELYLYCITERSLYFYFFIIVSITFSISIFSLYSVFPLHNSIPVFKFVTPKDIDYISRIKPLNPNKKTDPYTAVAQYLIENYLIQKESYNYNNIKQQNLFILNNSSRSIYRTHQNYINLSNANSPLLIYQHNISKNVKILDTRLYSDSRGLPTYSDITFDIIETDNNNNNKIINTYGPFRASLTFDISDLRLANKNLVPFSFKVIKYEVRK